MRRRLLIGVIALTAFVMCSCGPGFSPHVDEATGYELLFELPGGCRIVYESFWLSTEERGYTGNQNAEAMLVTATYVIENDGEATTLDAIAPAPMVQWALAYPGSYYRLTIGDAVLDGNWMFRTTPATLEAVYASAASGMTTTAALDPGLAVYRHVFLAPESGKSATAAVVGEGMLVYDRGGTTSTTVVSFDDESETTEVVVFSLGEPAEFTFDYDAGLVTSASTYLDMVGELATDREFVGGYVAWNLSGFLATESRLVSKYDLVTGYGYDPDFDTAFAYRIPLPSGTTTIEYSQPIWASCDFDEESCVYRFGFDEDRYHEGAFPVLLTLTTGRRIVATTFPLSGDTLSFDSTKSLLEITTPWTNSDGSYGQLPLPQD